MVPGRKNISGRVAVFTCSQFISNACFKNLSLFQSNWYIKEQFAHDVTSALAYGHQTAPHWAGLERTREAHTRTPHTAAGHLAHPGVPIKGCALLCFALVSFSILKKKTIQHLKHLWACWFKTPESTCDRKALFTYRDPNGNPRSCMSDSFSAVMAGVVVSSICYNFQSVECRWGKQESLKQVSSSDTEVNCKKVYTIGYDFHFWWDGYLSRTRAPQDLCL